MDAFRKTQLSHLNDNMLSTDKKRDTEQKNEEHAMRVTIKEEKQSELPVRKEGDDVKVKKSEKRQKKGSEELVESKKVKERSEEVKGKPKEED